MVSAVRFSPFLTRFGMLTGGSADAIFKCCVTVRGDKIIHIWHKGSSMMKQYSIKKIPIIAVLTALLFLSATVSFAAPLQRRAGTPDRLPRIGHAVKAKPKGRVSFVAPLQRKAGTPDRLPRIGHPVKAKSKGKVSFAAPPQRKAGTPDRLPRIGHPVKVKPKGKVSFAVPPHRKAGTPHRLPRIGHHVKAMPKGFIEISLGMKRFFYHGGAYYRRGLRGYVVVPAPIGVVLSVLPPGFQVVIAGSSTYYRYGGVYYRPVPTGYMVVQEPVFERPSPMTAAEGDRVTVTANILNVRSGPGLHHAVLTRIHWGTVVVVRGCADGWLYVDVPGGTAGWVMTVYTSPQTASPAMG